MNFTLKKSDLNFKVYTVPSKPTTPGAENDIAIISSVPMTNWIMSPDKPSGVPRNDGDVWIRYSTSGGTRNILKQNALMIATISAWQYVENAWVNREAVSCQGGAWVDWWNGYAFDNGNQYEAITGGWVRKSDVYCYLPNTTGSATVGQTLTVSGAAGASGVLTTKNAINMTNYKTVKLVLTEVRTQVCISIHSFETGNIADGIAQLWAKSTGEHTIDITDVSGLNFVSVGMNNSGYGGSVSSIKLE